MGQAARQKYTHPNDDFIQPGNLYRKIMTDQDRDNLIGNVVTHLCNVKKDIQRLQTKYSPSGSGVRPTCR